MKKVYTFFVILGLGLQIGLAQQPTVDVTVENPRIIGNTFNFDIYIKRTNDIATWYETAGMAMIGDGSWVFVYNYTDLAYPPTITYTNTTLFPPGAGYTFQFFNYGNIFMEVNHVAPASVPSALRTNMVLDQWYHMFTVSATITGTASNLSNLVWSGGGVAFTNIGGVSNIPTTKYDSDCNIALNTKSWDGSELNGDWNDADNWSPAGVPSSSDNVIYPNLPADEVDAYNGIDFGIVNNLRINHLAELHVIQNKGLTVSGNTVLKGGDNLVLEASTSPVPNPPPPTNESIFSSAFIPQGAIDYTGFRGDAGHIEVHRTLFYEETSAGYYLHQVAAPVNGVILDDWDMIPDYSYAYEWNTLLQDWWNIYVPSRLTRPGYGFVLSLYGQIGASTQDVVFYDNLMLANVPVTFTGGLVAGEWALVGNPFTAPMDWLLFYNQPGISNATWIWDPTGGYVSYVQGTGGNPSAQYIQPGQSFWIQATGAVAGMNLPLAARSQNIRPYLKDEYPNLLRVYTEGGNETSDETYIRFKEGEDVTANYDVNHDGEEWPSMYGEFATEIYTVTADGKNLVVDARPMLSDVPTSVPLSFKPTMAGEYKLHADEESMNSFDGDVKIMLEDTFIPSQDWIDMRAEGSYTFEATMEGPLERFIIHFWLFDTGIEDGLANEPIKIYSDRTDAFIINDSEQLIKEIQVYDISGNLMVNKSTVNSAITRIFVSEQTGYYVVRVITDKAVYSEKLLITK